MVCVLVESVEVAWASKAVGISNPVKITVKRHCQTSGNDLGFLFESKCFFMALNFVRYGNNRFIAVMFLKTQR